MSGPNDNPKKISLPVSNSDENVQDLPSLL